MIVTAWNNGKHDKNGAGYAFRVTIADRDKHFKKEWKSVQLILEDSPNPVKTNLKPSFWRKCSELRGKEIGMWLLENCFAPWPKSNPPKFKMRQISEQSFHVTLLKQD